MKSNNNKNFFLLGFILLLSIFQSNNLVAGSDPEVDFSVDNAAPVIDETINFYDGSSGGDEWTWSFGDNLNSTDQNPSHNYQSAGVYTVSLKVQDGWRSMTETKTDFITVYGAYPITNPKVTYISRTSADIGWTRNTNNDEVVIALVTEDFQGYDKLYYNQNEIANDGANIIYVGSGDGGKNKTYTYDGFTKKGTYDLCIWSFNSEGYSKGEEISFIKDVSSNVWQGNSSDWSSGANWINEEQPTDAFDVFIPVSSDDPIISKGSHFEMNNLTIDENASLTISPGAQVTVNGNITCDADNQLIVTNETEAPASIIVNGDVNTKVQVEWAYASGRYWYIGQATNGATVGDYGIPTADVYIYDFPGYWNPFNDIAILLDSKLEGYSVMFKDPKEVIVSGELNTGEQSRLLPENSDRLVANPYLSYLNLDNSEGIEFGDAQQTVWTRTTFNSERALATYNLSEGVGANGGTKYIAPGQSFWVQTNSQSTTFKISYAAREHGEGALKSTGNANSEGVFRFVMSDGEVEDEGVLIFREYGESSFSTPDSEKKMVSEAIFPQVYSLKSDKKVTISVVSNQETTQSIPLGMVIPADGEFTFNATNISGFMPEYGVTLEDISTGNLYDIRNNPTVSLSLSKGTYDDRFLLHFTQTSTDVEEGTEASETTKPTIYAANGDAYIRINSEQLYNNVDDCFVEVYDFTGKKYINLELLATQTQFELPEENKLWIIVVRIGNNSYQEKVGSFR